MCRMKKLLVFLAVGALACAVSCKKDGQVEVRPIDKDAPEWMKDKSLPVPIEFGVSAVVSTTTKTDYSIEQDGLFGWDWFRYGVIALGGPLGEEEAHPSINGIEAKNVPTQMFQDGTAGGYKTQFVDDSSNPLTFYYPIKSDVNWTFYGYYVRNGAPRYTSADITQTSHDFTISGIEMGACDILWAKAAATEYYGHTGYNADYVRAIMNQTNYMYLGSEWAPHLKFEHKTARFIFNVKAESAYAESTMEEALVTIDDIKVSGLSLSTATLNIKTGALTPDVADNYGIKQVNRDETTPFQPVYNDGKGKRWGDPLFIFPTDLVHPDIQLVMTIKAFGNADFVYTQKLKGLEVDDYCFKAGKSYIFNITIKSYEKIEINTEVQDWTDVPVEAIEIG